MLLQTQGLIPVHTRLATGIILFLIVFFSLVTYINALPGGFLWDDVDLIVKNETIKSWDNLVQNISTHPFFHLKNETVQATSTLYYRPLITLSYMIDYSLWGENPLGYHITNLLWHLANGVIIYFFTLILFENSTLALIASLLFITHPIHTESVSWVSGRTDIISSFFFFCALYLYCLGDVINCSKKWWLLSLSLMSFILALSSKEMAIVLPLIIILIDTIRFPNLSDLRARLKYWLPYWVFLGVYLFVRLRVFNLGLGGSQSFAFISKPYLLLTFGRALIYYLAKLVWPVNLTSYVSVDLVTGGVPFDVVFSGVLFFGSLLVAYLKKETCAEVFFSILFFWILLIPVSNIIPLSAFPGIEFPVAERFLYIPSFAFCVLLAAFLCKLTMLKFRKFYLGTTTFVLVLFLYTGGTIHANTFWRNEAVRVQRDLEKSPNSFFLNRVMGKVYIKRKNYDQAISYYLKAIQLNPDYAKSYYELAYCYYMKGDFDKAIVTNQSFLEHDDKSVGGHFNLGMAYWKAGKIYLAMQELREVLKLDPSHQLAAKGLRVMTEDLHKKENNIN